MTNWFKKEEAELDLAPPAPQTAGQIVWELVKVLVLALVIVVPIRLFVFQPFYVQGQSMEPTFEDRDYLIIDEITYRARSPQRGEVVVFRYPGDPSQYYIKRIIGLPGERIVISDSQVRIYNQEFPQGLLLDESYLGAGEKTYVVDNRLDRTLGPEEFFLLGDNRLNSSDSRRFGPVKKSYLIGRVWLRGWPINRATAFSGYDYPLTGE